MNCRQTLRTNIPRSIVNRTSTERAAAAAETLSEHPIGKAIAASYKEQISAEIPQCEDFRMTVGRGVSSVINGRKVLAGNIELLKDNGIFAGIADTNVAADKSADTADANKEISEFYAQGSTVIYVGIDGEFAGYIVLSDVIRSESSQMILKLSGLGVMPVLLTGDNKNAAKSIAKTLHIEVKELPQFDSTFKENDDYDKIEYDIFNVFKLCCYHTGNHRHFEPGNRSFGA